MDQEKSMFVRPIEAARLLAVSLSRLYAMLYSGALPSVRLEGRNWRIPRIAIQQLADTAMNKGTGEKRDVEPIA